MTAEMAVKRQVRQKGVGEHQVEVLGREVGLPQPHDARIRD